MGDNGTPKRQHYVILLRRRSRMTRISSHHLLGASRRLPPRITLLASSHKYKVKEERKRILKLSVKKLRAIEDPEAFLTRSVLINNTLKRLQTEVREEKASKKTIDYNPSPYSFYSIEKAYREEMERLDSNGNKESTSSLSSQGRLDNAAPQQEELNLELHDTNQEMFEADDEADSDESSASSSSSSSSEEDSDEEMTSNQSSSSLENNLADQPKNNSLEDDLLSEVYMPTPPPPQMIGSIDDVDCIDLKPSRPSTPVPWSKPNPSAEAVMKSSCDNNEADLLSEAVRTECWTKPVDTPVSQQSSLLNGNTNSVTSKSTLTSNSVNTQSWPNLPDLSWPSYTPSANANTSSSHSGSITATVATSVAASEATNFQPNITVPSCSSHKENLYNSNSSQLSEKCYSCGQSSLFQSELQSVVFNSLIASLET